MKKIILKKNVNKDIININDFYVIDSSLLIKGNKIIKNKKKKKIVKQKFLYLYYLKQTMMKKLLLKLKRLWHVLMKEIHIL